jgi:Raf kinase inhibitor-like YbhB/YbcL family protein
MKNILEQPKNAGVKDFKRLKISSQAFSNGDPIPPEYTCDGKNTRPPLDIDQIPKETKCLAILVIDYDAPLKPWVHWLVWNIPITHHLKSDASLGVSGVNDFSTFNYSGPCPNTRLHRYYFKVYALDELLELSVSGTFVQFEKAISDHIVAFGELMGTYERK